MIAYEEKANHLSNDYLPIHAFRSLTSKVVSPHWHYYIELLYLVSGSCQIYLDNQLLHMKSEEFLWIPSHSVHYILPSSNTEFLVLQFSPKLLQGTTDALFEKKYLTSLLQVRCMHLSQMATLSEQLYPLFITAVQSCLQPYTGYELDLKASLYNIFSYLFKTNILKPAYSVREEDVLTQIECVKSYIEQSYGEPLNVSDGCELISMSYHHFCRTFKKVTGMTFMAYVHFIRLREAQKLLLTTSLNMTDIALQVGFMNSAYFSSVFKKQTGLSPLSYRNKHKFINSNHDSHRPIP